MKIIFQKEEFLNSLNIVSKALKKGNLYKILDCILINANKEKIILTCQDGKEITIKTEAKGTILEKGIAAIEGSNFIKNISKMPENSEIVLEVNKDRDCFITCGEKIHNKFQSKDETTYPNSPSILKENKIIINELKIKRIIEKTIFSYDRTAESGNIVLKGIYFNVDKENFTAKSMDGYIISIINEKVNGNEKKYEKIVPGSALEEINKLIKGEVNKDVYIYFNEKNIAFEIGKTLVTSIIIPNNYIDTDRIFSIEYSTKININRTDFINALDRSTTFIVDNDKKPVILNIKDDLIELSLNSLSGESYEKIDIKKSGKDLVIAFNANNLIKVLSVIDDENIDLYFSGPKNPVIIKDRQETYSYLLTPVKI